MLPNRTPYALIFTHVYIFIVNIYGYNILYEVSTEDGKSFYCYWHNKRYLTDLPLAGIFFERVEGGFLSSAREGFYREVRRLQLAIEEELESEAYLEYMKKATL